MKISKEYFPLAAFFCLTFICQAHEAPVAHWKFDEATGTTAADSAGNFDGTLSGSAAFVSGGISGNAIRLLNAGNSLVNMGNTVPGFTSGDYTIAAWIKTTATNGDAIFAGKHLSGNSSGYLLGVNTLGGGGAANKANFYPSGQGANIPFSTTTVNDGTWHQVVGVYTAGGNARIYVDGVLEGTRASPTMAGNTAAFLIGGITIGSTPSNQYEGLVDDVQLYPSALTQTDITYLFTNPGQPLANEPPSAVAAFQILDANAGTIRLDGSGSSDPDGTIASYDWEWYDGENTASGEFVEVTFPYGENELSLTVTDDDGGISTETITVSNPAPEYTFETTNNEVTITRYYGAGGAVAIPETLGGNPVTVIGENAFQDSPEITSITIPAGVTSIDDFAFSSCSEMTSVVLPDSLISIGNDAFSACFALTDITFPGNLESIGNFAFFNCSALTNIVISGSVTTIGSSAFRSCSALESIVIPANVSNIGSSAFRSCSSLKVALFEGNAPTTGGFLFSSAAPGFNVVFPGSSTGFTTPTWLGYPASVAVPASITSQPSDRSIYVDTDTTLTVSVSGNPAPTIQWYLGNSGDISNPVPGATETFFTTPALTSTTRYWVRVTGFSGMPVDSGTATVTVTPLEFTSTTADGEVTITGYTGNSDVVTVPATIGGLPVTVIGDNAFQSKSGITDVVLPAGIREIGDSAFGSCLGLERINFPAGLITIGSSAFFVCNKLDNITLPDGLTSIGGGAFRSCSSLSGIVIPDSVETIGGNAFRSCTSMTQLVLPNGLTVLEANVLMSCEGLTSITIPDSVLEIKAGALSFCFGLTHITIPGNVGSLGARTFQACSNLTTVSLPESLTSLGTDLFTSCPSLASISFPSGIGSIPARCFVGCSALTEVHLPGNLTHIQTQAFKGCSSLLEIIIPDSVTTINANAFENCSSLTSVTIPVNVGSIGSGAFVSCTGLTSAIFPGDAPSMGSAVFDDSAAGFTVYFTNGASGFTVPTWLGYPSATSEGSTITTQPASQTILSGSTVTMTVVASGTPPPTFQWYLGTSGDTSSPIPGATGSFYTTPLLNSNTSFWVRATGATTADSDTATITVGQSEFTYTTAFGEVTITGYTGSGGTVSIPATIEGLPVKSIGANSFENNDSVTLVLVPDGVTGIGFGAFFGCSNLTSVFLPASVTRIDGDAFRGCSALVGINLPINLQSIGNNAFRSCFALTGIVFPAGLDEIGLNAFRSCNALTSAIFLGDAPTIMSDMAFLGTAEEFTVYYFAGSTGFTTPTWFGYPSVEIPSTTLVAPEIVLQPSDVTIASGTSATLSVAASGNPPPQYQWYVGVSGDESQPVDGATTSVFTTPNLNSTTIYWVRASNSEGTVNSDTATVTVEAGTNANLASLDIDSGTLSPGFNQLAVSYSAAVPNSTTGFGLTATTVDPNAGIRINGFTLSQGAGSLAFALSEGQNTFEIVVTSANQSVTKTYTLTVLRAESPTVTTDPATNATPSSVVLRGTVDPNGSTEVYFEYGPTTAYGNTTPSQFVSGQNPLTFQAPLSGLPPAATVHYRAVVLNGGFPVFGQDRTIVTLPPAVVVVTGNPVVTSTTEATLVGAVNTSGIEVEVFFEYGTTLAYGNSSTPQTIPAGSGVRDVFQNVSGLIAGANYHVRLVVSSPSSFPGNDVEFEMEVVDGSGTGSPTDVPSVATGAVVDLRDNSATLKGTVNSMGGTTTAYFEYGTTTAYGQTTAVRAVGNDTLDAEVSIPAENLLPGTTYFYRIIAENSLGGSAPGNQSSFTTKFSPPIVTTGQAEALTTTSVRVRGTVRARNADTGAEILFGTNPASLSDGVATSPDLVTGNSETTVTAELENLLQSVTYYYRVRAVNSGGTTLGAIRTFKVTTLSGILQVFPGELLTASHQGSLQVDISPTGIGAGWRLAGEQVWRLPGDAVTGLTSGDRIVEYRPATGYIQPSGETVTITSGDPVTVLSRTYTASGATGSGGLTVALKPDTTSDPANPVDSRAQWRLIGETDSDWKDSGSTVTGLVPGSHVVECKPVVGRSTPPPASVLISDGVTTSATLTYFEADGGFGSLPAVLEFDPITTSENLPYAFVGQIRSDAGSSTGFVVRPRVVATVAHAVFDDGTLASATGLQWLFQRHRETHEPTPRIPRGFYTMTGYAAQRSIDNSPGISTPESQHLDAAAMYFTGVAGRSGFSGYLASDLDDNEFLLSANLKTLVGYPIEEVSATDRDRMHATTPANITFTRPPEQTRTFTTQDIRSAGGNSGGPICVLAANGKFYPAAIYLGGTGQTVVRAIDSEVATLFGFAEISGDSASGSGSGNITDTQTSPAGTPTLGSLKVVIEPAGARTAGAGWRIGSGSYRASGDQIDDLDPNNYGIQFSTVPGFEVPATPSVAIVAGELKTVTFTYEIIIPPPAINSPAQVTVDKGDSLVYQITATNSPDMFGLSGLLPLGTVFDPATGRITGVPQEAGRFEVTVGVSNPGGTDTKVVEIISLPLISAQSVNAPFQQQLAYQIVSSESGGGAVFAATNLPPGLSLNQSTGEVSGTPTTPGTYASPISITVNGASRSSVLTFEITGTAPTITTQPAGNIAIDYGSNVVLTIEPGGLPAPSVQWYRGTSGDTSQPIPGATDTTFASQPLTASTSFWARLTNLSGTVDSITSSIQVLPSTNANLSFLSTNGASLSPAFNPGQTSYSTTIPNSVANIRVTPNTAVPVSTVQINGTPSPINTPSNPIPMAVGVNPITVRVTAQDGVTTRNYVLTVTRADAPSLVTLGADGIDDISATVRGGVNPNGSGQVFFEYGPTTEYGGRAGLQQVSGSSNLPVSATLTSLNGGTTYHYRIGFFDGGTPAYGEDMTFTTAPSRPLVVTGNAVAVSETGGTLIGIVNPKGSQTNVYFRYGTDPNALDSTTAAQDIGSGNNVVEVVASLTGLTTGETYYYRAVAESVAFAQPVAGQVKQFIAEETTDTGDGLADGPPIVIPGSETATSINEGGAVLESTVNPNDGSTLVYFEYGTSTAYGFQSAEFRIGNGTQNALVTIPVSNLETGVTYFFRTVAENAKGVTTGTGNSFSTSFQNPSVTTGQASAISTRSARVNGTVQPNGAPRDVYFRYGTDGITFPQSVRAFQQTVDGSTETAVHVDLVNLDEGVTYFYKLVATDTGEAEGTEGEVVAFNPSFLVGFIRQSARSLPGTEQLGKVTVNLLPSGTGNWRFSGEQAWRISGETATGLAAGDRTIEFRPVQGLIQPPSELITISATPSPLSIERLYYESASTGSGSLQVTLLPTSLSDAGLPISGRAQWRLASDADLAWKDSGQQVTGLLAGTYLIECKPVPGWDTPVLASVRVEGGGSSSASITYFESPTPAGNPPGVINLATAAFSPGIGYSNVGQIRSQSGSYSGFAVKPRVVATVAQAVFDEATLTTVTGIQWLLQRDEGNHEPKPLEPRGSYFFTGYDTRRTTENTPGDLSLDSQDLNVAALYFLEDAGRGGFSGFLGSDENDNEFLVSANRKILAGYPANQGRMYATSPDTSSLSFSQGKIFTSNATKGTGGMAGGPLFVQYQGGDYYPAGIYLGGKTDGLVRAIDSITIDLFTRAEVSGNGGDNNTGGGISQTSVVGNLNQTQAGSLRVVIEPSGANSLGAAWQLAPESNLRQSGAQKSGLTPGVYNLHFSSVSGFSLPTSQTVTVTGGQLTTLTFTYQNGASPLDAWRFENFQTYDNTGDAADDQDPDRDGVTNIDEFTAGTDPNSSADFFRLTTAAKSGSTYTVGCSGKAGRIYTLQRNTGLIGMWTNLSSQGPLASDGQVTLSDTSAPVDTSYYRIAVSLP